MSWLSINKDSDFQISNIPFGIFSIGNSGKRVGTAIGDQVLDLFALAETGFFDHLNFDYQVFDQPVLNSFINLGKAITNHVRKKIQETLLDVNSPLQSHRNIFFKMDQVTMHLPVHIGDYTDFYSSIEHATNVGKMFRDPENALLPNWKHLPVGYHGRSSSIINSGIPIIRPKGQIVPKGQATPIFQVTNRLDFELEMGFIIGKNSDLGLPISIENANKHIFGMVLLNDWSARDIQKWEYVPLGPFLGKSFASSISPWIVTMEALEPFRVSGPIQNPPTLDYLKQIDSRNYDIDLEVIIQTQNGDLNTVTKSNFKYMYWSMAQQLAHHTSNGCNVNVGDLMASGTISGKNENSYGSMLELAWNGTKPITLKDGSQRIFLEDGDSVIMKGMALSNDSKVGFGEVSTKILPAIH